MDEERIQKLLENIGKYQETVEDAIGRLQEAERKIVQEIDRRCDEMDAERVRRDLRDLERKLKGIPDEPFDYEEMVRRELADD